MKKRPSKESRATQSERSSTDDLYPNALERFERAVDIAVATKPMHRELLKKAKRR
jgi:hypothetical protein